MKREDEANPFAGMRAPRPSPELRERVLRSAARAAAAPGAGPTIWDRLWASRGLRVAWAVAVAALLLAHATVGKGRPAPGDTSRDSVATAEPDRELGEILELERIEISPRAEAIALGGRGKRSDS